MCVFCTAVAVMTVTSQEFMDAAGRVSQPEQTGCLSTLFVIVPEVYVCFLSHLMQCRC